MTNALKHARAGKIVIGLAAKGDLATLSIADDGQGFPVSARTTTGSGLRIMHYRAELIGAEFRLARNWPRGTLITCTLAQQQPPPSQNRSEAHESRGFSYAKTRNDGIHGRRLPDLRSRYGPL